MLLLNDTNEFTSSLIKLRTKDKSPILAEYENIIHAIENRVVFNIKQKQRNRSCNVEEGSVNLTEDVRDDAGRRRFSLKAIEDEPVMIPDINGFWTPANDKQISS